MQKISKLVGSMLLVGAFLTGCGGAEESSSGSSEPKEEAKPAEQKDKKVSEPKKDEAGNTILDEVGQTAESEAGKAELMKIKKINETVDIAPLKVTVQDMKLIKLSDVDPTFAEELAGMTDGEAELLKKGFSYIQVKFTAENTADQNVEWYDLANVITDKGEQIDGMMKDFLYDDSEMNSEFIGKVKKEYTDAFVIKNEDVAKVKLVFSSSVNADSYEDITGEQTVEYTFE